MGDIFSGPKMKLPEVKATKMPDAEDPLTREAGRRRRAETEAAMGRESTNLTGTPRTYSNTVTGA
jgi:hypothetical protein